jgi:hypothetical protein
MYATFRSGSADGGKEVEEEDLRHLHERFSKQGERSRGEVEEGRKERDGCHLQERAADEKRSAGSSQPERAVPTRCRSRRWRSVQSWG